MLASASQGGSGPRGVSAPGGSGPQGVCSQGGGSGPGGRGVWVWSRGCVGLVPGGVGLGGGIPACTEADTPPLWTESQTPVKTLPWPKFVALLKILLKV